MTLYNQLHNSASHKPGFDPACAMCVSGVTSVIGAYVHVAPTANATPRLIPKGEYKPNAWRYDQMEASWRDRQDSNRGILALVSPQR